MVIDMKAMLKAARKAIQILMFTTNYEIAIFRIGKRMDIIIAKKK